MFEVIGFMFIGTGLGWLLRRFPILQQTGKCISATIWLMLFFLGASIGSVPGILQSIGRLGGQAALLALAGTAGSVLAASAIYRAFRRKEPKP